ncbi:MAG TPA: hypothetical protein VME44_22605 [Streptosporangiaceae bacterium]|nr:hypothetical protein [Streptosporangiaceae bacterium]
MGFELVDDESYVRGVQAVGLREFAEGHRPVLELKEDLSAASAKAESERLGEFAVAVVVVATGELSFQAGDPHGQAVRP